MTDNPRFKLFVPEPHGDLSRSTIQFTDADGSVKESIDGGIIDDLRELVEKWEDGEYARKYDYHAQIGMQIAARELREVIENHD